MVICTIKLLFYFHENSDLIVTVLFGVVLIFLAARVRNSPLVHYYVCSLVVYFGICTF